MIDPELLAIQYGRSAKLLLANLEGLTHQQSLWQPAPGVNTINWLTGHLISSRCNITWAMGFTPIWDDSIRAHYRNGSAPITEDREGVLPLERLIADFNAAQNVADAALRVQTPETLSGPSANDRFATRAEHLLYMHMHEAHHAGQVMTLREQLGLPSIWPF